MPRKKKAKLSNQMTNLDDDDQPRMMISVKTLAGYLPTIQLKHDATVTDLADAIISSDPDAYCNCRPVFIRAHADGSSEELEDESRQLSSFGLQCGVVEELVLLVDNFLATLREDVEHLRQQTELNTVTAARFKLIQRGGRYVTTLKLGFTRLGDALCFAMAPALASLTSLTDLNLCSNDIGDAGIQIIASGLKTMKSLMYLELSNNKFGVDGFCELATALKELKSLTHLGLHENKIDERGGLALAAALSSLQALQNLGLNQNLIGDTGVGALISAMKPLVNLKKLYLRGTGFENKACEALTTVLSTLVSLQELTMDFCQVGFPELTQKMIAINSLTEVEIHVDVNRIQNSDDVQTLAASLMNLKSLKSLFLNSVPLENDRCNAMGPAFATLKSLENLVLCNVCGDGGGGNRELANMLSMLESPELLEYLKLSDNRMLDFAVLAPSFSKLTSLYQLDLSKNRINAQGCRVLAHYLPGLISLEGLNLDENEIDSAGCCALAPALASMRSLRYLHLCDNQCDVGAFQTLIAAAQSINSLRRLTMRNRNYSISKETCRELVQALASVQYDWSVGDHYAFAGKGCYRCNEELDSE